MPVGDFDDQRGFVMKLDIVNNFRKLPAESFGQEYDPDFFIGDGFLQSIFSFVMCVYDHALYTCQSHPCVGIDIVADQKHLHLITVPGS